jgi:integrase
MQLTNQIKKERDWSNKAVNKNVGYFAGILKILKDWEIIPHNPAHDIAKLPEAESEKYTPYTSKDKKDIKDALLPDHFRFYVLFMIVYHTGIRPKEVLALKVSDINLTNNEIKIVPDLKEGNSKTKSIRHVPINPHLKELLLQLGLDQYHGNNYVFGSPYSNGQNHLTGHKRQLGMSHPDYFKPSPNRIPRNNITRLWKELIWEGARVHKYLYAAKHTGGDDKILAGVDLDALRDLYGHSSKQMT